MSQMIHFRDDLFLISLNVKALDAALAVEADPEFWRERVIGDVFFIDNTIRNFADILAKNRHLVDRADYLRLLERLALDFARTLARLESGSSSMASSCDAYAPQIHGIIAGQQALSRDLGENLDERTETEATDNSIVSGDELAKLLGEGGA